MFDIFAPTRAELEAEDRPRGWCWLCETNVRAVRLDRSAEVGVYAIDEVCEKCGENVTEPKNETEKT